MRRFIVLFCAAFSLGLFLYFICGCQSSQSIILMLDKDRVVRINEQSNTPWTMGEVKLSVTDSPTTMTMEFERTKSTMGTVAGALIGAVGGFLVGGGGGVP